MEAVDKDVIDPDIVGQNRFTVSFVHLPPGDARHRVLFVQALRMVDAGKRDPRQRGDENEVASAREHPDIKIRRTRGNGRFDRAVEHGQIVVETDGDQPEQLFAFADGRKRRVDAVVPDHFPVLQSVEEILHPVQRFDGRVDQRTVDRHALRFAKRVQPRDIKLEVDVIKRQVAPEEKPEMLFPLPCLYIDLLHRLFPPSASKSCFQAFFDRAQPINYLLLPTA